MLTKVKIHFSVVTYGPLPFIFIYLDGPLNLSVMVSLSVSCVNYFISYHFYHTSERKPALMSNGFFALIAPFFMVFEVLNKLTGYKDEELKQLNFVVEADIAHYR